MSTAAGTPTLSLIPTDEELAIRDAVRGIVEGLGPGYARRCYEADQPPTELWQALGEQGFVGINIPEEWGGGGMGMSGLRIVGEELARAGGSTLMLVVSSAIAGSVLPLHGTAEQNERWLRGIAAGTTKFAFAITEPDAGTNSHNIRTELRRAEGGGYLLKGQKTYISGVEDATHVLVVARFRDPATDQLTVPCLVVVDVDAAGFTRDVIPMPYLGPDKQWTLYFDDVAIEGDRLIGGEQAGLAAVFDGLNPERIIAAALANGQGLRAIDKAAAYAKERQVFKSPIGAHQAIAHPLAKAKVEVELARLMTQKSAALFDAGSPEAGEASNMAKYASGEATVHAVDAAIQTHGGNGLALEYGVSDMWWAARLLRIAPVSEQMILNHVAQHTLGLRSRTDVASFGARARRVLSPGVLDGQVAIVSGGGTGIGQATVLELVRLGATVVTCGRRQEPLDETVALAPPGRVEAVGGVDIREDDPVDALVDGVLERHGRIDILVNNAGGQFMSPAGQISRKGFRTVVRLNLEGTWNMTHTVATKAFIPSGRGGRVVSVTLTPHTGLTLMAHSSAARAGVENLMKTLAVEWARFGINCVSVAPGVVATDTFRSKYPKEFQEYYLGQLLAGEPVASEDVAQTIAFLVSPAGRAITGSTVNVDFGHDLSQQPFPPREIQSAEGAVTAEARKRG